MSSNMTQYIDERVREDNTVVEQTLFHINLKSSEKWVYLIPTMWK